MDGHFERPILRRQERNSANCSLGMGQKKTSVFQEEAIRTRPLFNLKRLENNLHSRLTLPLLLFPRPRGLCNVFSKCMFPKLSAFSATNSKHMGVGSNMLAFINTGEDRLQNALFVPK